MIQTTTTDRLITWASLLPPLLLLAAAYWLNQQVQPLPSSSDSNKRHDPDFMVLNFSATTLNEMGTPQFMIAAQKMLHYPDDDSTYLEAPQLTSLNSGHPALYTSADKGAISGKGDEVFLHNNVKIVRAASTMPNGDKQSELVFTTPYLHVIPDRDVAETDQLVTMTDAHNKISAVGMRMDNKARIIKLLAQVSGKHEISKK